MRTNNHTLLRQPGFTLPRHASAPAGSFAPHARRVCFSRACRPRLVFRKSLVVVGSYIAIWLTVYGLAFAALWVAVSDDRWWR